MISNRTFASVLGMHDRIESELRAQLSQKDAIIADLRERLISAESKVERFELYMVPGLRPTLTQRKAMNVDVPPFDSMPEEAVSWYGEDGYLARYLRQQEKFEKSAKEKADGIQIEGRQAIQQSASGPVA